MAYYFTAGFVEDAPAVGFTVYFLDQGYFFSNDHCVAGITLPGADHLRARYEIYAADVFDHRGDVLYCLLCSIVGGKEYGKKVRLNLIKKINNYNYEKLLVRRE